MKIGKLCFSLRYDSLDWIRNTHKHGIRTVLKIQVDDSANSLMWIHKCIHTKFNEFIKYTILFAKIRIIHSNFHKSEWYNYITHRNAELAESLTQIFETVIRPCFQSTFESTNNNMYNYCYMIHLLFLVSSSSYCSRFHVTIYIILFWKVKVSWKCSGSVYARFLVLWYAQHLRTVRKSSLMCM